MHFPLSLADVSLWIAFTAIILLLTSELLASSEAFGDFVIEKTRLRIVALVLGAAFMITVLMRIAVPA